MRLTVAVEVDLFMFYGRKMLKRLNIICSRTNDWRPTISLTRSPFLSTGKRQFPASGILNGGLSLGHIRGRRQYPLGDVSYLGHIRGKRTEVIQQEFQLRS